MRTSSDQTPVESPNGLRIDLFSWTVPVVACFCVLGLAATGFTQEMSRGGRWVMAGARHEVFVPLPMADAPGGSVNAPAIAVRSHEAGTQRVHVVEFEGETYTATTPLDGPSSRVVFDPDRRGFAALLPSIRMELPDPGQLDRVMRELGATGVTVFDMLGFVIVQLPPTLHPAEAVARVEALPGSPKPHVRLRGPRTEWR